MDYMIDIVWFGDSVIFIFKELTGICKFRPSEATKKQKTPAEEPADTPLEPPDVSWGFDLGMLGMGWNCFNVLLEDFIEVSCFWFSWGSIAAPTDEPGKAPDAFFGLILESVLVQLLYTWNYLDHLWSTQAIWGFRQATGDRCCSASRCARGNPWCYLKLWFGNAGHEMCHCFGVHVEIL